MSQAPTPTASWSTCMSASWSPRWRGGRGPDRGMVTAEAALVLPVLVALTVALAWLVALGVAQVRLVDAAREAARLAARGEPAAEIQRGGLSAAPEGSTVRVQRVGDDWVAQVEVDVSADLPLVGSLPSVGLSARAVSAAESSTGRTPIGSLPSVGLSARAVSAAEDSTGRTPDG